MYLDHQFKKKVSSLRGPAAEILARLVSQDELCGSGLAKAIDEAGLHPADVVLTLLRAEQVRAAERVSGIRIKRYVPFVPPWPPREARPAARVGDYRRFTRVQRENPRQPLTPAWYRYNLFRTGRTITEFLQRGGIRRDIREALENGWVELEDE